MADYGDYGSYDAYGSASYENSGYDASGYGGGEGVFGMLCARKIPFIFSLSLRILWS